MASGGFLPDKLLGIRDGFRRFFTDGLALSVSVSVTPRAQGDEQSTLPHSDQEILDLARAKALELKARESEHLFIAASEAGLLTLDIGGRPCTFVRSWTVILGFDDEAWGSSGSVQLPNRLISGLDGAEIPSAIPGTRRGGGLVAELTGQLETRRSATALATFQALATLCYGFMDRSYGGRGRAR